ncbi:unnamed protein product [Parascedosporium putredinis]|uniref:D-mandelate dehydrogenase n=1 Tax=Parascedosporium putredinis TaxID=1442378 RepID=A0A9P1GVZ8_9PEZI|nr:unnamed protein product [Parascedosporium putredinis]CAI7988373.1 unnamed protein product [Parascedosporium putredinis]
MADPTNTPMPPSTPVPASTPRSSSPAPPLPDIITNGLGAAAAAAALPASLDRLSPVARRPRVLHIGDPIKYNFETYASFSTCCEIIRPSTPERARPEFIKALKEERWGDFDAIFRPFWGTGGEMGQWDAELIQLLPPSVKVFASAGAGFDWADTKLLGSRGVIYCNSGLAAAEAVADFGVAMIISTFRHLPWCITASGDGAAFKDCHARATGVSRNLRGQVLGIIGMGNIGQQLAVRLRHGFAMEIHYHDVLRKPVRLEKTFDATFHDTLESLVRASDCVVLCTPSGPKVITYESGARFVNVARGSLVDEEALAGALEDDLISAIALDVHASEPHPHPRLLKFAGERAMLTCHNAGGTVETHRGFEELSMRNIMAAMAGSDPITPVNMQYLVRKSAL